MSEMVERDVEPGAYQPTNLDYWMARAEKAEAEVARLRQPLQWIINDAAYKAPEQLGDVGATWYSYAVRALFPEEQTEDQTDG